MSKTSRNHIKLSEHFSLYEFENIDGLCCVHPSVIESLERLRLDLCAKYGETAIFITDAIRTPEDNARLAVRLGYTDQGGLVARDSRHLLKYHGIAVDIVARARNDSIGLITPKKVGRLARLHFDYVKDNYTSHIHCDNRNKLREEVEKNEEEQNHV